MAAPGVTPNYPQPGTVKRTDRDQDWRPDTRQRTLMFVSAIKGRYLELLAVGEPTTGCTIRANVPPDAIKGLVGRHVWMLANWGGEAVIEEWLPLPEWKGADNG